MRYFFLTLLVALFAFAAYQSKKQDERRKERMSQIPPTSNEGLLDSFTNAEVSRAIRHAHEEYGTPSKIISHIQCVDSARESVDVVKGKSFFAGVYLSKGGDTLFICPMAFKVTKSKDKALYHVVLDELIDHKLVGIDKSRRHSKH